MKFLSKKKADPTFPLFFPHRADQNFYLVPSSNSPSGTGNAVPPPETYISREKYGTSPGEYLKSGQRDVDAMIDIMGRSGISLDSLGNFLDFGCGDGRMIRWFEAYSKDREIWGTDINATRILWCKQHLNPPFHFLTNMTVPHLPFTDGKFGFIYAGSVFSHIDDMADAWLAELKRILRPNGVLFITVHLKSDIPLLTGRYQDSGLGRMIAEHPEREKIIGGNFDVLAIGRSSESFVFYDLSFLQKTLEPLFEVLSVTSEVRLYQNGLLLRRR